MNANICHLAYLNYKTFPKKHFQDTLGYFLTKVRQILIRVEMDKERVIHLLNRNIACSDICCWNLLMHEICNTLSTF